MISCLKVFIFLCEQGISFIILFENWAVERRFLLPIYVFIMLWNGYSLDLDQYP